MSRPEKLLIVVVLLAILEIAGLAVGAFLIYNGVVSTTYAPYLLGETEQEAIRMARNAGLDPQVVRQSDKSEAGTVILQSHDFGFAMKRGDVILITVSSGPLQHAAPAMVKLHIQQHAGFQQQFAIVDTRAQAYRAIDRIHAGVDADHLPRERLSGERWRGGPDLVAGAQALQVSGWDRKVESQGGDIIERGDDGFRPHQCAGADTAQTEHAGERCPDVAICQCRLRDGDALTGDFKQRPAFIELVA